MPSQRLHPVTLTSAPPMKRATASTPSVSKVDDTGHWIIINVWNAVAGYATNGSGGLAKRSSAADECTANKHG